MSSNGTLGWDGFGTLRIRYDASAAGLEKLARSLRTRLGERTVPVEALQGISLSMSPGAPVVTLELREHADPLLSVSGGSFAALLDPYRFFLDAADRSTAEWLVADVKAMLARRQVPTSPSLQWLVAPPVAPDRIEGRDATVFLAGGHLAFAYKWTASRKKKADGERLSVPLADITDVEWTPNEGRLRTKGFFRISTARTALERPKPRHDPAALLTDPRTDVDVLFFAARLLTRIRP
ncbi:DUF4429 domain-containing protein [Kribbella sp. NPDC050124]|uniref:DUF4429 domain-containing protein n=1 Tax=Kribbella sp. NPDC050124 TaxID=3364114 RepID=UPI003796D747